MAFNTHQLYPAPNSNSALTEIPVPSHQAPFSAANLVPPKPILQASLNSSGGVNLTWKMALLKHHAAIVSFRIYFCKESDTFNECVPFFNRLGDVPALSLPMIATFVQFVHNERYTFIIRAIDVHNRLGESSDPVSLLYKNEGIIEEK